MIPLGDISARRAAGALYGTSSARTEKSRMRLHMRWLYCDPKSSTAIVSVRPPPRYSGPSACAAPSACGAAAPTSWLMAHLAVPTISLDLSRSR